jgi:hypothetical protein
MDVDPLVTGDKREEGHHGLVYSKVGSGEMSIFASSGHQSYFMIDEDTTYLGKTDASAMGLLGVGTHLVVLSEHSTKVSSLIFNLDTWWIIHFCTASSATKSSDFLLGCYIVYLSSSSSSSCLLLLLLNKALLVLLTNIRLWLVGDLY